MRVVIFDNTANWPLVVYPEEGVSAFGPTVRMGNDVVGEYNGASPDPNPPTYLGTWPIPPADPPGEVRIQAWQLFDPNVGFTADEYADISSSTNNSVKAALQALTIADTIDLGSPEVAALLAIFVAAGDLTQQRMDELITGVTI